MLLVLCLGLPLPHCRLVLTNSSWHVLPGGRVEQRTIGTGKPGDVTSTLRAALVERIDRETVK